MDNAGRSALVHACTNRRHALDVVRLLLRLRPDLAAADTPAVQRDALAEACVLGSAALVPLLLAAGADPWRAIAPGRDDRQDDGAPRRRRCLCFFVVCFSVSCVGALQAPLWRLLYVSAIPMLGR